MVAQLILSVFPGIGLFDMAFDELGFCVVRGPDILWAGDIKKFHPPAGRFDGLIGGPPCQHWSSLAQLVRAVHGPEAVAPDLIPEFERCVDEAAPAWFVMENVPRAPAARVPGYHVHDFLYDCRWTGAEQSRRRRFSWGTREGSGLPHKLAITDFALEHDVFEVRTLGGGSGKIKKIQRSHMTVTSNPIGTHHPISAGGFERARRLQGLPADWDLPGFKISEKVKALANGVPLPLGRVIARAVMKAVEIS